MQDGGFKSMTDVQHLAMLAQCGSMRFFWAVSDAYQAAFAAAAVATKVAGAVAAKTHGYVLPSV